MTIQFRRSGTTSTQDAASVGTGGQSWAKYSVGGNRSNNTWYQNTTNGPIQVAVGVFSNKHLRVGSATNNYIDVIHTGNDASEAMNGAIVPNNHYYQTDGYRTWTELR